MRDILMSFMPNAKLGMCRHACLLSCALPHLLFPLAPDCSAFQAGFRRLQRLCNMPLKDMEAAFNFECGQVWRLGGDDEHFDIYIQEAYVEMLPLINNYVALGKEATKSTRCMVRGTPGIGKTMFAWARIVMYIKMIKAGKLDGMSLDLDELDGHCIIIKRRGFSHKLKSNNMVQVYDLGTRYPVARLSDDAVHADVSLSWDGAHLNGIIKSGSHHMLLMPLVCLEEARMIAAVARPAPPDGWEESFRLLGGTLREPFSMPVAALKTIVGKSINTMSAGTLGHVLRVAQGLESKQSLSPYSPYTLVVAGVPSWPSRSEDAPEVPRSQRCGEHRVCWAVPGVYVAVQPHTFCT